MPRALGGLECPNRFAQADASGRSHRRVLLSNKLERLCGPRHQLAVEAHPIGVEPLPESACVERSAHRRQELALQRGIFEESPARARVTDPALVLEDPESLASDVVVPAHDDDGAGTHVLLLDDDRRDAVGPVVRERLGWMLQQALSLACLAR